MLKGYIKRLVFYLDVVLVSLVIRKGDITLMEDLTQIWTYT